MTDTIIERAKAAARKQNIPYAGDVTPLEAGQLLAAGAARVIDVRSCYEWEFVGRIDPSTLIEWRIYEAQGPVGIRSRPNDQFIEQLKSQATPADTLLFLCRSGVRSQAAAAAA